MCDIAYVLMVEQVLHQADMAILAARLAQANGADVRIPDVWQVREDFDRALASEPDPVDDAKASFRLAHGLN